MAVVVMVVGLCASSALALDPMGPPTAGLKAGQLSAGLDYAFSEADLEFDGKFDIYGYELIGPDWQPLYPCAIEDKLTFEAVEMHKAYLTIGYGIQDNWEAFLRIGGARAEAQKPTRAIYAEMEDNGDYYDVDIYEDGPCHDFDSGFAVGLGTKATLYEEGALKIGVLGQASWTEMDIRVKYQGVIDDDYWGIDGLWAVPVEGDLELWEIQIAVGATYELSPKFTVYGGPFFYMVDGDYDFKGEGILEGTVSGDIGVKGSYDVEEDSSFGGYVGAQIEVTDNAFFNAECILTGDGIGVGTGLAWKF